MEVDSSAPRPAWRSVGWPAALANPEAYRRDRRKDALLQENGYFVLRFLAEDVGKRLDLVLDTIVRLCAGPAPPQVTAA